MLKIASYSGGFLNLETFWHTNRNLLILTCELIDEPQHIVECTLSD